MNANQHRNPNPQQHHQHHPHQQRHSNSNNNNNSNSHHHHHNSNQAHSNPAQNRPNSNNPNRPLNPNQNRPQAPSQNNHHHHHQQPQHGHHGQQRPQQQTQHHQQQRNPSQQQNANKPQQAASGANANQPANNQNAAPPLPAVLPKGWKREEVVRTKGISAGLVDVVYVPAVNSELSTSEMVGKKFKTKLELSRVFGDKYDTALLNFRTGKVNQIAFKKQRRVKSLASANNANYTQVAKYDAYLYLPVRQTASIFKQPVHVVTNHRNEPAPANAQGAQQNKPNERPRPVQLFWEYRFNNLRSVDSDLVGIENIKQEFELENIPKFGSFNVSNENVMRSIAVASYMNPNKQLNGQGKDFTKNARVFINRDQPLIPEVAVKEDLVKQQEEKLKEIRNKLKIALEDYENFDTEFFNPPAKKRDAKTVLNENNSNEPVVNNKLENGISNKDSQDNVDDGIIIDTPETKLEPKTEPEIVA